MSETDRIIYEAAQAFRETGIAIETLTEAIESLIEAQDATDEEGED